MLTNKVIFSYFDLGEPMTLVVVHATLQEQHRKMHSASDQSFISFVVKYHEQQERQQHRPKMRILLTSFVAIALLVGASAFTAPSPAPASPAVAQRDATTFSIAPDDLVARAQQVLGPEVGIGTMDGGECLADNFNFCAAYVGPLPKEEYLDALGTFGLTDSFDIQQNSFGFTVSPYQPYRVYWFSNSVATMKAPFFGVDPKDVKGDLIFPPQVYHMDFNEEGKVTEFGFYTVDRQYGNTGGLGGAFGYFYGVGRPLPFPEGKPYKPSFRFGLLQLLGKVMKKFQKK